MTCSPWLLEKSPSWMALLRFRIWREMDMLAALLSGYPFEIMKSVKLAGYPKFLKFL